MRECRMRAYSIPNRIVFGDAYTLSSFAVVSPAMKEQAAYHLVSTGCPTSSRRRWGDRSRRKS